MGSTGSLRSMPIVLHRVSQPVSRLATNATLRFCFLNIPDEVTRLPSITSSTDHVARLESIRISCRVATGPRFVYRSSFICALPAQASSLANIESPRVRTVVRNASNVYDDGISKDVSYLSFRSNRRRSNRGVNRVPMDFDHRSNEAAAKISRRRGLVVHFDGT